MAKASLKLSNGTTVEIEGSPKEVQQLLEFYEGGGPTTKVSGKIEKVKAKLGGVKGKTKAEEVDLLEIVNLVKNCDEAESIEDNILDRTSAVNRILLPLYIVHEYLDNKYGLTTGDVSKITTDLGIPVSTSNVSHCFSGTAARYVIRDKVRKKGQPGRYKLSRRGLQYLKEVLKETKRGK